MQTPGLWLGVFVFAENSEAQYSRAGVAAWRGANPVTGGGCGANIDSRRPLVMPIHAVASGIIVASRRLPARQQVCSPVTFLAPDGSANLAFLLTSLVQSYDH